MSTDICSSRHRGAPESVAAHRRIEAKIGELHRIIMDALNVEELTSKELEARTGMTRSTVSARLSELKAIGRVVKTGARRDGAAVVRLRHV